MNPLTLKDTIKAFHKIGRPLCVEGSPGVGKTQIIQQSAEELNIKCITKHLPTMLVEDFGILFPNGNQTLHYRLPDWFPTLAKDGEEGILLFDDRNQGGNDLQKVLANITQARELHGHRLPDGWSVMSTGNRQKDRAGSNKVLSHLRNRETVVELDVSIDDWVLWASGAGVNPMLISFAMFRPNLLNAFEANNDVNATPRSWVEGVGRVMDKCSHIGDEALMECYSGAVGDGPATEFMSYMAVASKLPDIDQVIREAKTYPIPKEVSVKYALTGALANAANQQNFDKITDFFVRWSEKEFAILCVKIIGNIPGNEKYGYWKGFSRWVEEFEDVLMAQK